MASENPERPRTQTSAPFKPARTTKDVPDPEREEAPPRQAGDERGDRGDRMPMGADEPGAGL